MAEIMRRPLLLDVGIACVIAAATPGSAQTPAKPVRAQAPTSTAAPALDLSRSLETTAQSAAASVLQIFTT